MTRKLWPILLLTFSLIGCYRNARFYPVQGPLSAQTPAPVLVGKVTGAFNSGDISVTLSDGEVCKGRWSVVPTPEVPKGGNAATAPANEGMPAAWDTVYGQGYYVAHVLGTRLHAQAKLTGDRGTILQMEMYQTGEGAEHGNPASIKGVAKDDKSNIYKVTF